MTDVNSYLLQLIKRLSFEDYRESAETSISYLKQNLWGTFQNQLKDVSVFGSFDRQTILPPDVDKEADVDVMVIFKTNEFKPQTYLEKLRKFSEKAYSRSEIFPDFPTMVIELKNLKFELVPAYWKNSAFDGDKLYIPGNPSKDVKWIPTNPAEFKARLDKKNTTLKGNLLPIILVFKYWNSLNNHAFLSFLLEKFIFDKSYERSDLKSMFFHVSRELQNLATTESQKAAVKLLLEKRRRLLVLEKENLLEYVEQEMQTFLPI